MRSQLVTVLFVGEGHAEEALLRHLKSLYAPRGSGVAVTIFNAKGKGAKHVVDYAIRKRLNVEYDFVWALLDTDTDWNDKVKNRATREEVSVVPCNPCLEALLLRVYGLQNQGYSTAQFKRQFQRRFGTEAHDKSVYVNHFGKSVLETARRQITELNRLLQAFSPRCPKN
ncbi:MAG: RloB family protein [Burkholderiaceae bacterium]|jgi:transposase-like protein|nr:RloB family protein [Burkholderiaceae bacterium]